MSEQVNCNLPTNLILENLNFNHNHEYDSITGAMLLLVYEDTMRQRGLWCEFDFNTFYFGSKKEEKIEIIEDTKPHHNNYSKSKMKYKKNKINVKNNQYQSNRVKKFKMKNNVSFVGNRCCHRIK
jgi:hypothetical protein